MKISRISQVELYRREKEGTLTRRSKILGVVLDYLEILEGESALFAELTPISRNAFVTIRKKRKKPRV